MAYRIIAGSGYGLRSGLYEEVDGKLSLVETDPSDNLAGNSVIEEFGGLTVDEAQDKIEYENDQNEQALSGHSYDGCHACQWRVRMVEE